MRNRVVTRPPTLGIIALTAALLTVGACAPRQAATPDGPGTRAVSTTTGRGTVVVDTVHSAALGARKQFTVYLPASYRSGTRRYPVAYYLHGAWGSEWDWVRSGRLDAAMDSLIASGAPEMIVVMPDGDDGWYTTGSAIGRYQSCMAAPPRVGEPAASYCVQWPRYDDYVARDLVAHVDSTYRTLGDAEHRGIGGLSMGGYGAVTLALAYPDVFSAAASHSGTLSILVTGIDSATGQPRVANDLEGLRTWWGERLWAMLEPVFGRDPAGWRARDPATLVRRLLARGGAVPALRVDVGVDDRYLAQSRHFAASLREAGVPVEYAEHPGKHDWVYWRTHVPVSLAWLGARIGGR